MGHTKYPAVAFDDWRTTNGYLYAVPTRDALTAELQVKLGSTRKADPVYAARQRYDTILARTIVWWLLPSANAYYDEIQRMHCYFADRRVYADRELFRFADEADFRAAIARFEAEHAAATRAEDPYKPERLPVDAPLDIRAQDRAQAAQERRDARQEARDRQLQAEEEERRLSRDTAEGALDTIITNMCDVASGLRVEASVFNSLARASGVPRGIKGAMKKRGYAFSVE